MTKLCQFWYDRQFLHILLLLSIYAGLTYINIMKFSTVNYGKPLIYQNRFNKWIHL